MAADDTDPVVQRRSVVFGDDALAYDRARPSYPSALVDFLLARRPRSALDVGCGTGKAARLFAARGVDVLGVEADERMAAVARGHGLRVEVAPFESWEHAGRHFPLLVSGQAWHWVDPMAGAAKAAEVLEPRGVWAVFWNHDEIDAPLRQQLDEVYTRLAPELTPHSGADRAHAARIAQEGIEATGAFGPVESGLFEWHERLDPSRYVERVSTHSDHRILPAERRSVLLEALAGAIDAQGHVVELHQTTLVVFATRR